MQHDGILQNCRDVHNFGQQRCHLQECITWHGLHSLHAPSNATGCTRFPSHFLQERESAYYILTPTPGLNNPTQAAWICASTQIHVAPQGRLGCYMGKEKNSLLLQQPPPLHWVQHRHCNLAEPAQVRVALLITGRN